MKLGIQDRLLILDILPSKGDIVNLRLVKELVEAVGLSQAEIKDWNVISDPATGQVKWDVSKVKDKEVDIDDVKSKMLADILRSLSKEHKLNLRQVELYETFCKT